VAAGAAQQLQRADDGEELVSGHIEVNFIPGEGAVLRMLGLVERRGFAVRRIAMDENSTSATLAMDVEARDPLRRLDVLSRQLERLIEVRSVAISPQQAGTPA
jgi:acetolactate synthase-1/3 small subunit/acetolactate synthase II small subunit